LASFLSAVLPPELEPGAGSPFEGIRTSADFIRDVENGIAQAPMSIRLTPHILSVIDWTKPFEDPIRRQFLPMKSGILPDHPKLTLDSLGETSDSPVEGLVHRYPDKALFLGRLNPVKRERR
jgi:lysine 2,3-aminomutase